MINDSIFLLLSLSLISSFDLLLTISELSEDSSSVAKFDFPNLPPAFRIGPIKYPRSLIVILLFLSLNLKSSLKAIFLFISNFFII